MSEPLSIEVGMTGLNPYSLNSVYPLTLGTLSKNLGLIIYFQTLTVITKSCPLGSKFLQNLSGTLFHSLFLAEVFFPPSIFYK